MKKEHSFPKHKSFAGSIGQVNLNKLFHLVDFVFNVVKVVENVLHLFVRGFFPTVAIEILLLQKDNVVTHLVILLQVVRQLMSVSTLTYFATHIVQHVLDLILFLLEMFQHLKYCLGVRTDTRVQLSKVT